jgi:hypothetical protein
VVARCTIRGTARPDVLRGTSRTDVICGFGGNDRITLGPGDIALGGAGADSLLARNAQTNLVVGGAGRDRAEIDRDIDKVVGVERVTERPLASVSATSIRNLWSSPVTSTAAAIPTDVPNQPPYRITKSGWQRHRFVGRLTYTKATGQGGSCSATLVDRNIVLTAAHCVWDQNGGFTDFEFAPNKWGAQEPFGTFAGIPDPAGALLTEYQQTGAGIFDYAFVKLLPDASGRQAGDVAGGWLGIVAGYQGQWYWSIGYPGGGWFSTNGGGLYPFFCYSRLGAFSTHSYNNANWYELGMGCYMTGGASGGPWIVDQAGNNTWTHVASVNSHCWARGADCPRVGQSLNLWGPYFTQSVLDLFAFAKTL